MIVGIRADLAAKARFYWLEPHTRTLTMADALKAGELYDRDVPPSPGQTYPEHKKAVLDLVPQGGCWRDLPDEVARAYMNFNGRQNRYGATFGMA